MEGKQVRFGPILSGQFFDATTGSGDCDVDAGYDSVMPVTTLVGLAQDEAGGGDARRPRSRAPRRSLHVHRARHLARIAGVVGLDVTDLVAGDRHSPRHAAPVGPGLAAGPRSVQDGDLRTRRALRRRLGLLENVGRQPGRVHVSRHPELR